MIYEWYFVKFDFFLLRMIYEVSEWLLLEDFLFYLVIFSIPELILQNVLPRYVLGINSFE